MASVSAPGDLGRLLADHRTEPMGHCHRRLGSSFDAEDAVRETLLRA